MQTINWTTGDGRKVEMTISAEFELDSQGRRKSHGRKEVVVVATLDGQRVSGDEVVKTSHPVAVAKFGTLGINQVNYDRYLAAEAAVEAEVAAHDATIDSHVRALDAVTAESNRIARTA